ncbi:MAG: hypothetical protein DRJ34_03605 [Thermoprotei archaeon]|nr:MAG: hypothetical protein DRJ34_03605 [Thermoprotei archaeon]
MWKKDIKIIYRVVKNRLGSQLIEEALLLGISLISLTVIASMASGVLSSINQAYEGTRKTLDQFFVKVLDEDFEKIWGFITGKG